MDDEPAHEPLGARGGRPTLAGRLGLLIGLRRAANHAVDEDHPAFVWPSRRVGKVAERAREVAESIQDDSAAIQALLAVTRSPSVLLRAAAQIRFERFADRSRTDDRANRLLIAAARRQPVQAMSEEDTRYFDQLAELEADLDLLEAGEETAGFSRLVALEPRLRDVERSLIEWRSDFDSNRSAASSPDTVWQEAMDRLDQLVGYESEAPNRLLRSNTAFQVARLHLARFFDD